MKAIDETGVEKRFAKINGRVYAILSNSFVVVFYFLRADFETSENSFGALTWKKNLKYRFEQTVFAPTSKEF